MFRRVLIVVLAVALSGLVASPAAGSPPDRFEAQFTVIFPDLNNEFVVFVNTDRASYCTAEVVSWEQAVIDWIDAGMTGDPPVEPAFPEGFAGIPVKANETGQGAAVVSSMSSGLVIELWTIDSEPLRPFVGPCTDSDDDGEFFARGTTRYMGGDNDFSATGTRGNAFGDRGKADITDADGASYTYSWAFHVNDRCYTPDDGPPRCLIDQARIRAI